MANKTPVKWGLPGLINLETAINRPMSFGQFILLVAISALILLGIVWILKLYAIPFLGMTSVKRHAATAISKVTGLFKPRSP